MVELQYKLQRRDKDDVFYYKAGFNFGQERV